MKKTSENVTFIRRVTKIIHVGASFFTSVFLFLIAVFYLQEGKLAFSLLTAMIDVFFIAQNLIYWIQFRYKDE